MTAPVNAISTNLDAVNRRIAHAARQAGRDADSVRLVAVSKFMDVAMIQAALQAGQTRFGENYVQEALDKQQRLGATPAEWHFIGHLQSNKARHVPGHFAWLHTLDSLGLARRLDAAASQRSVTLNVLLQVNIAADPGKQGLERQAVYGFTDALLEAGLSALRLQGLMTIGRQQSAPAERRADFAALRELGNACASRFGAEHFRELSMGMSNDFEIAIAEGATQVRIGSAIFGARPAT